MQRLGELFQLYYNRNASAEQTAELMQLIQTASPDQLNGLILEHGEKLDLASYETLSTDKAEAILQHILGKTVGKEDETGTQTVDLQSTDSPPRVHRIHFRLARWWAAAAILIMAIGSYFIFFNKTEKKPEIATVDTKDVQAPSTTKATITLANGKIIYLDSINNGTISIENNVTVIKTADGKIIYSGNANEVVYNTLHNPRGSKVIDMQLSDGSHVWLNAGSSVTYPVAFVGNERKVSITGEAYLDVTHNPAMPFKLKKGEMEVTVLGTKFNVNAYDDEADIKVTLLEGSVKVSNGPANGILKPGQQAQVGRDIKIVSNVDLEEVMAWKNGKFQFGEKADIGMIMRQIARWYDVDVEYKGTFTKHFGGSISREVNVSQVLKVLQTTGNVNYKVEGRKVTVMPL